MCALVVGKGGPKLKEAVAEPEPAPEAEGAAPKPGTMAFGTANGTATVTRSSDGRGATVRMPGSGTTKMTMNDGVMHMEMSKVTMKQFAEALSNYADRPVVDKTGLTGNYQVSLEMSLADLMQIARANGIGIPGGAMAPPGAGAAGAGPAQAADPGSGGVFSAVQALGLKLEPRKEPVETIVVDHAEKTPTEN
jgi:uncharacterized protein (TIGR03435 family)